jgi:hypothetical protein
LSVLVLIVLFILQTAVLDTYHAATSLDPNSYAGWHAWAMVNFRIMEQLQLKSSAKSSTMKPMNPATSAKIGRQLIVSATYAAQVWPSVLRS